MLEAGSNRAAVVFMNGRTPKHLFILFIKWHKFGEIPVKWPDGGNRFRKLALQSQAMKLESRKRRLPVCTNSERLLCR